jgi:hypothetical protein
MVLNAHRWAKALRPQPAAAPHGVSSGVVVVVSAAGLRCDQARTRATPAAPQRTSVFERARQELPERNQRERRTAIGVAADLGDRGEHGLTMEHDDARPLTARRRRYVLGRTQWRAACFEAAAGGGGDGGVGGGGGGGGGGGSALRPWGTSAGAGAGASACAGAGAGAGTGTAAGQMWRRSLDAPLPNRPPQPSQYATQMCELLRCSRKAQCTFASGMRRPRMVMCERQPGTGHPAAWHGSSGPEGATLACTAPAVRALAESATAGELPGTDVCGRRRWRPPRAP